MIFRFGVNEKIQKKQRHTMKKQKFLAPIYGLKKSPRKSIKLDKNILIRAIDLFAEEHKYFKSFGLKGSYDAVLEVNYEYDSNNPSEPFPGLFINLINKFDASLVVYGDGIVGVAGVIPATKDSIPGGGILSSSARPQYEEKLDKEIDEDFATYYKNFVKAYDMRPAAFDVYRRSCERFSNNDRAIDSCTILESLFVPPNERSKKSFILYGLNILRFNTDEIKSIDDLIEYRNAIIHADRKKQLKLLSGSKYTHKWFEDTFKLIRRILYKYVESPWS